jgi:hypothetical protein
MKITAFFDAYRESMENRGGVSPGRREVFLQTKAHSAGKVPS